MNDQAKPQDEPNEPFDPERVGDLYPDPDADPDSEPPWRPYEWVFACCPESDRLDVFFAALSMFGTSGEIDVLDSYEYDPSDPTGSKLPKTIAGATDLLRRQYTRRGNIRARIDFAAPTGRMLETHVSVGADIPGTYSRVDADAGSWRWPGKCLYQQPSPYPKTMKPPSLEVEAGLTYTYWMTDIYTLLIRLCTVNPAITTGGCGGHWCMPITGSGSYHADGYVARDLARTWWHLVHADFKQTSGYSLADLRACVEASPRGQSLSPAVGVWFTREEVLAAMDVPKEKLLAALQACAAETSPEWRAIEGDINRIRQTFEYREGADVEWTSFGPEHAAFLKKHAPFVVKQLDSGAVVMLASPWRNFWPLWSDALSLLGIRP